MKSSNIPENTQGNKEGLVQWANDHYADNQPWILLGPGIGESRGHGSTLRMFEVQGLYVDLRINTDKYGFNVLGVQPWNEYQKGEYRDAMEWLLNNRKPSKIILVLLSLGGYGFLNNTSPEDIAFVLSKVEEVHIFVTGPPLDRKAYNPDHIKAIAASGKPVHVYSSANDTKSGTSFVFSQTLHDQLKAAGANVTITLFEPGFGHNGTATHVWYGGEFYKWAATPVSAPIPMADPVIVPDVPAEAPPVTQPTPEPTPTPTPTPVPDPAPRELVGYYIYGQNIKIEAVYKDQKEVIAIDPLVGLWVPKKAFSKPTVTFKGGASKGIDVK